VIAATVTFSMRPDIARGSPDHHRIDDVRAISGLAARAIVLVAMAFAAFVAQAGTITYFHNDLLGSPVVATNASGQVIWKESYRPYGERLTNAPESSENDVWFTSRRQEADTGLVYMGARYYDPTTGRFISTDPKTFDEKNVHSFNRYIYANNNPYRYTDPDGREPGDIYQRGYAPPPAQIFPEPGLIHVLPEVILFPVVARIASQIASSEAPLPAEMATFYRAVSQAERKQIERSGQLEVGPNSLGGKWLAESRDAARQWGDALNGKDNSSIMEVQLPRTQADQLLRVERLDGIGPARYGEIDQLRGATMRILE
jgi:RHS repeat-associated protein